MPFSLLIAITKKQNKDNREFYEILNHMSKNLRFQISSSNPIKFQLKYSESFENILLFLEPRINYVNILTDDKEIIKQIELFFDIEIENKRIISRPLVNLLRTFCIYKKRDNSLPLIEFKKIQKKWRDQLFF